MGAHEEKKTSTKLTSNRGRRRLDFKRFQGKSMFLDLPGYRQVAWLEEELTSRGATLETQFHSGVKYLITMTRNGDSKNPSQSPSTPSPNTPGTAKSSLSQLLSPATDYSPSEVPPRQGILTRSQQMLQLSRGRGGRKADLRSLAQQWGCKVVSLEDLLAEIRRLKPLPSSEASKPSADTHCKIRTLKGPFLKVEDMSRTYRPLVLEMKRWPRPLCHTSHKACPFDPPNLIKFLEDSKPAPSPKGGRGKQGGGKDRGEMREKRPGHCECCCVKFEDLHMHLSSARHQEYANNEENFQSLDQLIAQGKPFSEFIHELRSAHSNSGLLSPPLTTPRSTSPCLSSKADSVVLVTLPTSHATPTRRSPRKHPSTPPKEHTITQHTPPPDSRSTPTNRKRKLPSAEVTPTPDETTPTNQKSPVIVTTPTNLKTPVIQVTPTKKLRFSPSSDVPASLKRPRRFSPPSSSPTPRGSSGSPASKRAKPATSSPVSLEGVRRSPRLLMKKLTSPK